MKILILIIGIALGAAAVWFYGSNRSVTETRTRHDNVVEQPVASTNGSFREKLGSMQLNGDSIKDEMAKSGKVIRENARKATDAIADATSDARITAKVKADLVRDPDLSAWNISVNTTDGIVTLAGTVATEDLVGKAMVVAMDTEGVRQVISTLQIKP